MSFNADLLVDPGNPTNPTCSISSISRAIAPDELGGARSERRIQGRRAARTPAPARVRPSCND